MTQHEKIHAYIMTHGSITPMEAFTSLGITKLATRIGEMIQMGKPIRKDMVAKKTNEGTVRFMRYSL